MLKTKSPWVLCVTCCFALFLQPAFAQPALQTEYLINKHLTGTRGGNLVVSVTSDPANFNRMLTSGMAHAMIADRISADLVHINRSTFELEPSLATAWETDKTGQNYTVHLRKGVSFSDGSPLTADDVIFSFQVLEDPKTGAVLSGQLQIDGAFPKMTKLDANTIRISFPRPVGMGLRMFDSVPIIPKARLLKAYQDGALASAWGPTANPKDVVGVGPFRIREYARGAKVVLERNPFYWKKDKSGQILPYLDSITFLIVPDLNSESLRFRSGELDLVNSLNPENYASLRRSAKASGYTVKDLGPGLAMDFLWFNLNPPGEKSTLDAEKLAIFEKPEFRKAVSHALDRQGVARSILLGLGIPQYGAVTTGNTVWHADVPKTEYDPARSRELLASIGLKKTGKDGILLYGSKQYPLEISLLTARGNAVREKMVQVIQSNLAAVGIRVSVQLLLPNELASRFLRSFDYESILFGFTPTDPSPDLQTDLYYSSGDVHFWCPSQKKPQRAWETEIDTLITQLIKSVDPLERKKAFAGVQQIWSRQMPAIPTVAPNVLVGWSHRVRNVNPSILVPHLLWNAEELVKGR